MIMPRNYKDCRNGKKSPGRLQKQLRDLPGQEQKNKKDVKEYQENIAEERKQKMIE